MKKDYYIKIDMMSAEAEQYMELCRSIIDAIDGFDKAAAEFLPSGPQLSYIDMVEEFRQAIAGNAAPMSYTLGELEAVIDDSLESDFGVLLNPHEVDQTRPYADKIFNAIATAQDFITE